MGPAFVHRPMKGAAKTLGCGMKLWDLETSDAYAIDTEAAGAGRRARATPQDLGRLSRSLFRIAPIRFLAGRALTGTRARPETGPIECPCHRAFRQSYDLRFARLEFGLGRGVSEVCEVSDTPSRRALLQGRDFRRAAGKRGRTVFRPFSLRFCPVGDGLDERKARGFSTLANRPVKLPIKNGGNGENGRRVRRGDAMTGRERVPPMAHLHHDARSARSNLSALSRAPNA